MWIHLLHHLVYHFSKVILDKARASHTSEVAVRSIHDGIDLEGRDVALPVQGSRSYSSLDSSADGLDGP